MMPRIVTPSPVGGGDPQLDAQHRTDARVLELEVPSTSCSASAWNVAHSSSRELQLGQFGVRFELGAGASEVLERGFDGALRGRSPHQVLQREVDERPLAGRGARCLRESLQVREAERRAGSS